MQGSVNEASQLKFLGGVQVHCRCTVVDTVSFDISLFVLV